MAYKPILRRENVHHLLLVDNFGHVVLQLRHILRPSGRVSRWVTGDEGLLQGCFGCLLPLFEEVCEQVRVLRVLINIGFYSHFKFIFLLLDLLFVLLYLCFALGFDRLRDLGSRGVFYDLLEFLYLTLGLFYLGLVSLGLRNEISRLHTCLV